MLFYKIDTTLIDEDSLPTSRERDSFRTLAAEYKEKSDSFYHKIKEQRFFFVSNTNNGHVVMGAISNDASTIEKDCNKYIRLLGIKVNNIHIEEITLRSMDSLLSTASRNDFVNSDDEILERFGIDCLVGHRSYSEYGESMIDTSLSKDELIKKSNNLLMEDTLTAEINRIYEVPAAKNSSGHPVHYLVRTDNRDNRKSIYKTLLSALYSNNRVKSKRYCFVDYDDRSNLPDGEYEALYRSCENSAIIVRYSTEESSGGQFAKSGENVIAALCEFALRYRNKVLTVFCLPIEAEKARSVLLSNLNNTSLIELREDVVNSERANEYLKIMAKNYKIRTDKNLFPVCKEGHLFTATELRDIFDKWYDQKLRNNIFPQYKEAQTVKSDIVKAKPCGSAYDELSEMVGLSKAKETIDQALNFYKAQKLFKNKNISFNRPAMHMIFAGNPGTAKTTVARLFAQIMKENGLLSKGDLYEVGRADLVGKYVGHTAPLVKQAFKKARGSVLFIDEAYSLVDDKDGLFGDEAINTIVQEMENNRDDMIVIFAGYPNKMEQFLSKNPGLRSRIAFHIPFEDYSSDELCDIAKMIASSRGLALSDDAICKLDSIFSDARKNSDFGNGRYARNLIEKAQMAQTNRLLKGDINSINDEILSTITADDIEAPKICCETPKVKIGFAS